MEIGDKAPEILGKDENGNEIRLSDFKGKKLVLYFYPKDSTPGCTAEACDLRDNYERFLALGYNVLGVSKDSAASQRSFSLLSTFFSMLITRSPSSSRWTLKSSLVMPGAASSSS